MEKGEKQNCSLAIYFARLKVTKVNGEKMRRKLGERERKERKVLGIESVWWTERKERRGDTCFWRKG